MQRARRRRVMLGIKREKVERLRDQVADQKQQAEAVVVQMEALTPGRRPRPRQVAKLVSARAGAKRTADATLAEDQRTGRAGGRARPPGEPDGRDRPQGARGRRACPQEEARRRRRRRRRQRRHHRRLRGRPEPPGQRPDHLALRHARPPDHRRLQAARRHRLRRRLRHPDPRGRRRHDRRRSTTTAATATASSSTTASSAATASSRPTTTCRGSPVSSGSKVKRGERHRLRRARPATPRGATCTSWSWSTAGPPTRWAGCDLIAGRTPDRMGEWPRRPGAS